LDDADAGWGINNPINDETMSAITRLTAEKILSLPDTPGKQELLDGELISLPPTLRRGWLIPDVSATWPDHPVSGWLQGPPMIAIEIVSRGNTAAETDRKVSAYCQAGRTASRSLIVRAARERL
jgi:hypothetical protein